MRVELAAILIGFLLICYFHQQFLDSEDLRDRLQRFYATMISKKTFAWLVVTAMFVWDRFIWQYDGFEYWEYLTFTCAVFTIDVTQKFAGLKGKGQL